MDFETPLFLALTAIAAAFSTVVSYRGWRDARDERLERARVAHVLRLRAAHDELADALLDLAQQADRATASSGRHSYTLARIRADHLLKLALHPDIEEAYGEILDLINTPPDELELDGLERALDAVFNSRESVGDFYERTVR